MCVREVEGGAVQHSAAQRRAAVGEGAVAVKAEVQVGLGRGAGAKA